MRRLLSVILMISLILGNAMPVMATSASVSGNGIGEEIIIEDMEKDSGEELAEEEVSISEEDTSVQKEVIETEELSGDDNQSVSENEIEEEQSAEDQPEEEQPVVREVPIVHRDRVASTVSAETERPAAVWTLEDLSAPVAPEDGNAYWDGPILVFGDEAGESLTVSKSDRTGEILTTHWRIVDGSKALLMSDGIFTNGPLYGQGAWENTELYSYLNNTFKTGNMFKKGSVNAIKGAIRIPTLDEMTNPAYGYLNSSDSSNTRVYGYSYALMPDDGQGTPYYVEGNGNIVVPNEENYPYYFGFVPTLELDMSKVCIAIDTDAVTDDFSVAGNSQDNRYQLFLQQESDFSATLPTEANQNESVSFTVETSGGSAYNELFAVLTSKNSGKIAAVGQVTGGSGTREKSIFISSDIPAGNYTLSVFEAIWNNTSTSAYAGKVVSSDFEVKGTSISEFEVTYQQYGSIKLNWRLENAPDNGTLSYTKVNIYRSESENGGYQLLEKQYACNNNYENHSYTDEKEVFNENGSNKTFYYKICIVTDGVESDRAHYTTNAGMHYGEVGEYQGMYFALAEDGTGNPADPVAALTLRPEEYKELRVVLFDEEGNLKTDLMDQGNSWHEDSTVWYICNVPVKDSADAENYPEKQVSDTLLEIVPVDFMDELRVGIVAHDEVEAGQVYYLMAQRSLPNRETYWAQIPIRIVKAEEGDTYNKLPSGKNRIYTSADELSAGIRTDMVEREKNSVYYVKSEVYEQWIADGGTNAVYDFNREREGMKPYEGDYLYWQNFDPKKIMSVIEGQWIFGEEEFNGVWWKKIESNQVYFTTKAQEDTVDAKIKQILSSGELGKIYSAYYRADGNYTTQVRKIIADACCDYVHKNTKYIGTPVSEYHSAWSAIINKTGTCQAYSLYLTRLLREFGIANKILTGTDKNYHTYNIVQIDKENDKWYYYDATGGVKYKTESEFERTEYQGLFLEDPDFIENYIAKIVGSTYAPQVYLYSGETEIGRYFTLQSAVEQLIEHNSTEGNENSRYRIELMGNADFGDGNVILPASVAYCELDLNGHTLTSRNGARMSLDKVHDGTIYMTIGSSMYIYTPENLAEEAVYENVKLDYEQANAGLYVYGQTYSDVSTPDNNQPGETEGEEGENPSPEPEVQEAQICFQNVQVGDNRATEVTGLVHMDEKSSLETAWLVLDNKNYEKPASMLANIKADEISMVRGYFELGNLEEKDMDPDDLMGAVDIRTGTVLNVYGNLSLGRILLNQWDYSDTPKITMNLMQVMDAQGNEKTGTLTFKNKIQYNLMNWENTCHIVLNKQNVTIDSDGNRTEPVDIKFGSGETIATVMKDTTLIPTDLFVLEGAASDEQIIRKNNKLIAARVTLKVSHTDTESGEIIEKEYISLEDAVASLKTDFAQDAGSYTVTFMDNAKLNGSVTFPSFVKELHLKAEGKTDANALLELDLGGYSISTGAVVNVYNNLHITNITETISKITTTASNGADGYAFRFLQTESANVKQASDIAISAAKGTFLLAKEDENEEITNLHIVEADISAKEVKVENGKWKLGTVSATTITNNAQTQITKINNVTNLYNKEEKVLVVDSYTQNAKGITGLEAGSAFVIRDMAKIYNAVMGASESGSENRNVYMYSLAKTVSDEGKAEAVTGNIALEGKVTTAEDTAKVRFAVLKNEEAISALFAGAENLDNAALMEMAPRTIIFTTGIKNFPMDLIEVNKEFETSAYTQVYQQDQEIRVGREWISIYTKQIDGSLEPIKSFIRWSDAASYLNTLANTSMEYVVEFSEDVEMTTALTLPAKVKGITFRGKTTHNPGGEEGRIKLTYTGDLKLVSNTTFENIELFARKYNTKKKVYEEYQSAVNVNGKELTMVNSVADFTSLAGSNAKSVVKLTDSDINVRKTVASVGYLHMENSGLVAAQSVAVTDTLTMSSSVIDAGTQVTLKNIITNDANNKISYGGNSKTNILNINGNISSKDNSDEEVLVKRREKTEAGENREISKTATVRKNAIQIEVKALENDKYLQDTLLCNASKAGAGWFVVGTTWETVDGKTKRVISHGTYKKGNSLYCGEVRDNVRLYSSDEREGDYIWESSFETLQEAFSEIDKIALNNKYYYVQIVRDTKGSVTFADKNLTFPTKAAEVVVEGGSVYMKDNLTLKCNTTFANCVLVPTKEATLSMGKFELLLEDCFVGEEDAGVGFKKISGSGVAASSKLTLDNTSLVVNGEVSGIGTLVYADTREECMSAYDLRRGVPVYPTLIANGKIAVGNIELETNGCLTGYATVTRNKAKEVTAVTPQITISGEVTSAENAHTLYLDLQEVVSKKYIILDFANSDMGKMHSLGIKLAKADKVTYPKIKAVQCGDSILVKTGGYLTYFEDGYGVELTYEKEEGGTITIPCRSFADAVTEINNKKIKRDYTITLLAANTDISGANQNGSKEVPKALTMPNKNYIKTLTIQSDAEAEGTVQMGFLGNITLTSDVTLRDVAFVQMIKSGSEYKTADVLKDDYPSALTVSVSGYNLTIEGNNTFNTPLVLNGGNKGNITFDKKGTITTLTNDYHVEPDLKADVIENVIYGSITAFNAVNVEGCNLTLKEFASARNSTKFTASNNKMTILNVKEDGVGTGMVTVVGQKAKGSMNVTTLNNHNGKLLIEGKVQLKDVLIEGEQQPTISADLDFNITGKYRNNSDATLLVTRLKGAGKAPYLNVSGTMERMENTGPVTVQVLPESTAAVGRDTSVILISQGKTSAVLLTAKNAQAGDFKPYAGNYAGGAYDSVNTSGYMMFKSGSNIYVYDGDSVAVGVYKGDVITENTLVGYYPSVKDATSHVNSLKKASQDYTYVLMAQNGSIISPVGVTIPSYASKVTLTSLAKSDNLQKTIYLSGGLTLNTKLVIEDIILAPIKNKAGTSFSISTGNYDLELKDVVISNESEKMELGSISGKGKQTVVLDTEGLEVSGSISNTAKLVIKDNVTVNGSVKVTDLQLENVTDTGDNVNPVTLSVKGAVTVEEIHNYGSKQNVLEFTRTAKDVSNLTINKLIENENALILLRQNQGYDVTALEKTGLQAVLADGKKFATMPRSSTDSFVAETKVSQGNAVYNSAGNQTFRLVKANKGIYLADSTLEENVVTLTRKNAEGVSTVTHCLDYAQAMNEINTIADAASDYEISLRNYANSSDILDTVVTDKNPYGSFALPGSNKKNNLLIKNANQGEKAKVAFTGNISGYGNVTLENVELTPVKNGSDSTPADVTMKIASDNTTQTPLFTLKKVSTKTTVADTTSAKGFITSITGTKNKTDVVLENCGNLIMKSGISSVDEVILKDTKLFTAGASTVNTIRMEDTQGLPVIPSWDSLGKLTVNDIYMPVGIHNSFVGIKQDKYAKPQFVLNNEVQQGMLLCKLYNKDTVITDADEIMATASDATADMEVEKYCDALLVSAKKASADRIRAYAFRNVNAEGSVAQNQEQITKENLISYKTDVYVVNSNKEKMAIRVTEHEGSENGTITATFYARSIDEAVTTINNKGDLTSYYVIQFIGEGTMDNPVVIKTTKNGTAYGAFTLPSKAAGVTIRGYEAETQAGKVVEPGTVIKYTGTLKASCNVTFENILLTEGSAVSKPVDDNDFTEKGTITPAPSNKVTITFEDKVFTVSDETKTDTVVNNTLGIASVNSGQGSIVLDGIQGVSAGNIVLKDLELRNGAALDTTGKVTLANLYADDNDDNKVAAFGTMSIGTIAKTQVANEIGKVQLHSGFTKIKKNTDKPTTQLTISGEVVDAKVAIHPWLYDLSTAAYREITEAQLASLSMESAAKPESYKKLANITKASVQNITVIGSDMGIGFTAYAEGYAGNEPQTYLYKHEKGLYVTDAKPLVKVTGYTAPEENQEAYAAKDILYKAQFLTWEQAVKEIDTINNAKRYYKIELADTIGMSADGTQVTSPIGTVTMPSKAAEVTITSEGGRGIFFTGTTISVKCPTIMKNMGFTCVKKYGRGNAAYYAPVTYTMNVGNYKLTQQDMLMAFGGMETTPYTITGSSKGVLEVLSGKLPGQSYAAVKNLNELIVKYTAETAEGSGYGNFVLDCSGDISVKNLKAANCSVEAKNITVSALTTLDEASLQAGTSAANDGKLTLKDMKLADGGNMLTAEQNKNGASQIAINGTVTATEDAQSDALDHGAVKLKLYYNNYQKKLFWWVVDESAPQKPAQLYNGMILCTAPKAEAGVFVPAYTVVSNPETGIQGYEGMGLEHEGYGLYKSGKNLCYGSVQ